MPTKADWRICKEEGICKEEEGRKRDCPFSLDRPAFCFLHAIGGRIFLSHAPLPIRRPKPIAPPKVGNAARRERSPSRIRTQEPQGHPPDEGPVGEGPGVLVGQKDSRLQILPHRTAPPEIIRLIPEGLHQNGLHPGPRFCQRSRSRSTARSILADRLLSTAARRPPRSNSGGRSNRSSRRVGGRAVTLSTCRRGLIPLFDGTGTMIVSHTVSGRLS